MNNKLFVSIGLILLSQQVFANNLSQQVFTNNDTDSQQTFNFGGVGVPYVMAEGAAAAPVKGATEIFTASGLSGEQWQAKRVICDPWQNVTIHWLILEKMKDPKTGVVTERWVPWRQETEMLETARLALVKNPPSSPTMKFVGHSYFSVRDDRERTNRETQFTTGARSGLIGGIYNGITDGNASFLWGQQDQPFTWPKAFYKVGVLNTILYPQIWTTMGGKLQSQYPMGTIETDAGGSCSTVCAFVPNTKSCETNIAGESVCGTVTGGFGQWAIFAGVASLPDGKLTEYPVVTFDDQNKASMAAKAYQFPTQIGGNDAALIQQYRDTFTYVDPTTSDRREKAIGEENQRNEYAKEAFVHYDNYDALNASMYGSIKANAGVENDVALAKEFDNLTARKDNVTFDVGKGIDDTIAIFEKNISDYYAGRLDPSIPFNPIETQKSIDNLKASKATLAARTDTTTSKSADFIKRENPADKLAINIDLNKLRADKYINTSYHLGSSSLTSQLLVEAQAQTNRVIELYPLNCREKVKDIWIRE
jgi:hypothetical protein